MKWRSNRKPSQDLEIINIVHTFNNQWSCGIIEWCRQSTCDTIVLTYVLPEVIDNALLHSMYYSPSLTRSQYPAQNEKDAHQ